MSDVFKKLMRDSRFVSAIAVFVFVVIVVELLWGVNYKPPVEPTDSSSVSDSSELQELLIPKLPLEKQQPLPEPWATLLTEATPTVTPKGQSVELRPHDEAWYMDRLRTRFDLATTPQSRHNTFWTVMCSTWKDLGKPSQKDPGYNTFVSYSDEASLYLLKSVMDGDMPYNLNAFLKDEIGGSPKVLANFCPK